MDQLVAHSGHELPWDFGMLLSKPRGKALCSLADDRQLVQDGGPSFPVDVEGRLVQALHKLGYKPRGVWDVPKWNVISWHTGLGRG